MKRTKSFQKYLIGEKYTNRRGDEYEIISYVPENSDKRKIRFIKTNYETITLTQQIKDGYIIDYLSRSVCGVGYPGYKGAGKHPLYKRWTSMINRCYNEKTPGYKRYGKMGVTVCERWHDFRNYVNDIEKKENYNKLIENPKQWHIDKDLLGGKIYSDETTVIISKSENTDEMLTRRNIRKRIAMYDLNDNLIKTYDSIADCARELNTRRTNISACLTGCQKTSCGHKFKYI